MSETLLLTGPSGSGKSTICNELASDRTGTWAYINQDNIRYFIKSGRKTTRDGIDFETTNQLNISFDICVDIIHRYYANNINCVVEAFVTPKNINNWLKKLQDIESLKIIELLPTIEVCLKRNENKERSLKLTKVQIENNFRIFSDDFKNYPIKVIDNSSLSVKTVINEIKQYCSS